jgi:MtN3 and saliva related transmembrane protein
MSFGVEAVGFVAGICTAVAQFPQAVKVVKSGDTESISLGTYSVMTFGVLCWFVYGLLLKNPPMIAANGVCLIPSFVVLFIKLKNSTRKNRKK